MSRLIDQFNFENQEEEVRSGQFKLNEDRATILYLIDILNKNLFEFSGHPVRKIRSELDDFAKGLMSGDPKKIDRLLFRFREFYNSYRLDEYTYIMKTFSDFRAIIWDFVEQIGEDLSTEQQCETSLMDKMEALRESVESSSLEELKEKSLNFIDTYIEYQENKDQRRVRRVEAIKKNLDTVKKQLSDANENMRRDHLTKAYNRKSFDEQIRQQSNLNKISGGYVSLMMLDIDHFKKVNDTYGHAIGDFVLVELVKLLKSIFEQNHCFVARVGGEEFAILLPNYKIEMAEKMAERALEEVRKAVFVEGETTISFTISIGLAELSPGETVDEWMKRADAALYFSKNNGRNRLTLADPKKSLSVA